MPPVVPSLAPRSTPLLALAAVKGASVPTHSKHYALLMIVAVVARIVTWNTQPLVEIHTVAVVPIGVDTDPCLARKYTIYSRFPSTTTLQQQLLQTNVPEIA